MSARAFVSGRLGKAVVFNEEPPWILMRSGERLSPTDADLVEIGSPNAEYTLYAIESAESLRAHLDHDSEFQDALFLLLSTLDPEISLSTKLACAQAVEGLLKDEALSNRLLSRVLSRPLPLEVRTTRRQLLALETNFDRLSAIIRKLFASQENCDEVWAAWSEVTKDFPAVEQAELLAEMTEDGTMAAIVEAASCEDVRGFNAEIVRLMLQRRDPTLESTAKATLNSLRETLQSKFFRRAEKQRPLPLRKALPGQRDEENQPPERHQWEHETQWSWSKLSAFEAKTQVDKQLAAINIELNFGRDDLAEKYIADLIDFQLTHSEREHLAKSLCQLASNSLDANRLDMADRLSQHALELQLNDPVIYTTRAEVLKNLSLFSAALEAYRESTIRFPDSEYAWVGVADVLHEMGKCDASLEAYRIAQLRFPDSAVPFNGYISVLRTLGRRRQAIFHGLRAAKRFPTDAVTRANLGGALREDGRYYQALRSYEAAIQLDGRNVRIIQGYVGSLSQMDGGMEKALEFLEDRLRTIGGHPNLRNLKASYLRRSGQFEDSLRISIKLIADYPKYSLAAFTLAATYVTIGNSGEALRVLPQPDTIRSENDWFGFRIYAVAHIANGEYSNAAEKLEFAIRNCPWQRQIAALRTALGYSQMKLDRFEESVATLERQISILDTQTRQTRMVFLGQAQACRGNSAVSSQLFRMVTSQDPLIIAARNIVLKQPARERPSTSEIQLLLAA